MRPSVASEASEGQGLRVNRDTAPVESWFEYVDARFIVTQSWRRRSETSDDAGNEWYPPRASSRPLTHPQFQHLVRDRENAWLCYQVQINRDARGLLVAQARWERGRGNQPHVGVTVANLLLDPANTRGFGDTLLAPCAVAGTSTSGRGATAMRSLEGCTARNALKPFAAARHRNISRSAPLAGKSCDLREQTKTPAAMPADKRFIDANTTDPG